MEGTHRNQTVIINKNIYEEEIKTWKSQFESMDDYVEQFLLYARLLIEGSGNSGYSNYFGDTLHPLIESLYENMEELLRGRLLELYTETESILKEYLAEIEQKDTYYKSSEFSTSKKEE